MLTHYLIKWTARLVSLRDVLLGSLSLSRRRNIQRFTRTSWSPPLLASIGQPNGSSSNIDQPHDYGKPITLTYTNDPTSAWKWADDHLGFSPSKEPSTIQVVGFDMESAPNLPWRKDQKYFGPGTIQLAVQDSALVLQIAQETDVDNGGCPLYDMFPFVNAILEHPSLLLAGVGMDQDLIELHRWSRSIATKDRRQGQFLTLDKPLRLDIGGVGVNPASPTGTTAGLKRLAASILQVNLPKSSKLAHSPWAKAPLPQKCVVYAARDAWASAAVLHRLCCLDPDRFSTAILKDYVRAHQSSMQAAGKAVTIPELSHQAASRRKCKQQWKELKEKGKESCTDDENERFESLQETIKLLAPPQPIPFEIKESLGIKV